MAHDSKSTEPLAAIRDEGSFMWMMDLKRAFGAQEDWSPTHLGAGLRFVLGLGFSGLAGGDRCEPGECTSHRNRHSGRRFLSRPTDEGKREGTEWEKGSFITQRLESVEMSAEIPLQ